MPHIILKLQTGRTALQKRASADALTQARRATAGCGEDAVAVGIEDVAAEDWVATVYRPDIMGRADTLVKKPGYDPLVKTPGYDPL